VADAGAACVVELLTTTPTSLAANWAKISEKGVSGGWASHGSAKLSDSANNTARPTVRGPTNATICPPVTRSPRESPAFWRAENLRLAFASGSIWNGDILSKMERCRQQMCVGRDRADDRSRRVFSAELGALGQSAAFVFWSKYVPLDKAAGLRVEARLRRTRFAAKCCSMCSAEADMRAMPRSATSTR
jgi:hypothetical protein